MLPHSVKIHRYGLWSGFQCKVVYSKLFTVGYLRCRVTSPTTQTTNRKKTVRKKPPQAWVTSDLLQLDLSVQAKGGQDWREKVDLSNLQDFRFRYAQKLAGPGNAAFPLQS